MLKIKKERKMLSNQLKECPLPEGQNSLLVAEWHEEKSLFGI